MEINYFEHYSESLGRTMPMTVYGHAGKPVLFIPCQDGHHYDFANFHMSDTFHDWIEGGRCMVFSIDTIDAETWSAKDADPYDRIRLHERWIDYITREAVPFIRFWANDRNGWDGYPGVMTFGCSMGATHAVNLYFRRPDLFDGLLALSGIYTASYGFGGYMDDLVYLNSPVDYLAGMPGDHPYIAEYNRHRGIIVVGTGPWEAPETTFRVDALCREKGIQVWVDIWGSDCAHDWDWWYKQAAYHIPHLLD